MFISVSWLGASDSWAQSTLLTLPGLQALWFHKVEQRACTLKHC